MGKSLLNTLPPIDWDSLTEAEASAKLALIRQACRDFYRPPEPKARFEKDYTLAEYILRLQAQIVRDLAYSHSSGPMIVDEQVFIKRKINIDEFRIPSKFETRGAGKNPFAVPHISKPPRKG